MQPAIAACTCVVLIAVLFLSESRVDNREASNALWIPFSWLFFAASRFPSIWLTSVDAWQAGTVTASSTDGSPLDRAVFTLLIAAGLAILAQRRARVAQWLRANPWVWLLFLYGAISVLWSDYPVVSLKRIVKAFGNLVMALIVVTEQDPAKAFGWIIRRLAYLVVPLSILYIKYFPDMGRQFHFGEPMYTGVASHKNGLGQTCLIIGIYLAWSVLFWRKRPDSRGRPLPLGYFVIIPGTTWLMYMADSATSLITLILGISILTMAKVRGIYGQPKRLLLTIVLLSLPLALLIPFAGLHMLVLEALGRDSSLTTRVPMWLVLLQVPLNWVVGTGFQTFWLSSIGNAVSDMFLVSNAHNGYLEVYLNLGMTGLAILCLAIMLGLVHMLRAGSGEYVSFALRFTYLVAVVLYNWTEAAFLFGLSAPWVILLIVILMPNMQASRQNMELRPAVGLKQP